MRIAHLIGNVYRRLVSSVVESAEDAEPRMFFFGLFGVVGYPLYYLVWEYLFPQAYESLGLRIACMCVAAPALGVRHWPKPARRHVALYWYFAILFCVPFFFVFMTLQNQINTAWSGSLVVAVLLVAILFDIANAIVMLLLGIAGAIACYAALGSAPIPWSRFIEQTPVYLFTLAAAGVFTRELAREQRAKIAAAMALGGHIAHELRTPLVAMRAAADFIDTQLDLFLSKSPSGSNGSQPAAIPSEDERLLHQAPQIISREVDHAFLVIDLALANTGIRPYGAHEIRTLHIVPAVEAAISRYPFKDLEQRSWIRIGSDICFQVRIIPVLLDHLVFNILKNAVYAIQAAGRGTGGEIRIWAETGHRANRLHFRDNGQGIPAAVVGRIFNPFFSTRVNGAGLGLHFCRTVMNRFDGEVHCRSELGRYTEMILEFPVLADRESKNRRSYAGTELASSNQSGRPIRDSGDAGPPIL